MAANNLLDEMIEKGDTSPKTASESFANFLNDMLSHENDYLFDTASVRKVWDYANSPYIAQWDIQNLIPSFHMDTARVSPVDTLQVKRGNLEDLIRELSHGVQYGIYQAVHLFLLLLIPSYFVQALYLNLSLLSFFF